MTRWYSEKKREHFYKQAKKSGYRARSSYKLLQIQKKFNVLKSNDVVVDLGAAPGGWSQVAKKIVGDNGVIVGVDLSYIRPIENIVFIKGDMTKIDNLNKISDAINGKEVDVVLSDMSPNISGNYVLDQASSVYLARKALEAAESLLRKGGCFVCKVFEGQDFEELMADIKSRFSSVRNFSPSASRKSSSEVYIVAKNFKGI